MRAVREETPVAYPGAIQRKIIRSMSFFSCILREKKEKIIDKSTEGGTHGKESGSKGSGKGSGGKEGGEETSEGRRKDEEEVVPSLFAPAPTGRGQGRGRAIIVRGIWIRGLLRPIESPIMAQDPAKQAIAYIKTLRGGSKGPLPRIARIFSAPAFLPHTLGLLLQPSVRV